MYCIVSTSYILFTFLRLLTAMLSVGTTVPPPVGDGFETSLPFNVEATGAQGLSSVHPSARVTALLAITSAPAAASPSLRGSRQARRVWHGRTPRQLLLCATSDGRICVWWNRADAEYFGVDRTTAVGSDARSLDAASTWVLLSVWHATDTAAATGVDAGGGDAAGDAAAAANAERRGFDGGAAAVVEAVGSGGTVHALAWLPELRRGGIVAALVHTTDTDSASEVALFDVGALRPVGSGGRLFVAPPLGIKSIVALGEGVLLLGGTDGRLRYVLSLYDSLEL